MAAQDVIHAAGAPADVQNSKADAALRQAQPVFETGGSAIDLPLKLIDAEQRLRAVDPVVVADLAVSVREGTLAHPITVRPVGGRYQLVVGAHRLAAFAELGRATIPAQVRQLTELEARQLEIDENLIRANLSALDRVIFMAERVEIWAERNPDQVVLDASQPVSKRGRPPKTFLKLRKIDGYVPTMMGFVADTARETKLSPQSVYRAVQTMTALPDEARARLSGTWVATNDAVLRQVAGLSDPSERTAVIDLLLEGRTKSVAEAQAIVAGRPALAKVSSNTAQRDFEKAWKAATPSQRTAMLDWLAGQRLPAGWAITGAVQ